MQPTPLIFFSSTLRSYPCVHRPKAALLFTKPSTSALNLRTLALRVGIHNLLTYQATLLLRFIGFLGYVWPLLYFFFSYGPAVPTLLLFHTFRCGHPHIHSHSRGDEAEDMGVWASGPFYFTPDSSLSSTPPPSLLIFLIYGFSPLLFPVFALLVFPQLFFIGFLVMWRVLDFGYVPSPPSLYFSSLSSSVFFLPFLNITNLLAM